MNALGLVPTREAETEEYKRSWQDKECLDALAALANTRGGVLWVGVQDDGSVVGWGGDGKEMERISNSIVAKLQVHPRSMTLETLDGKLVLAIQMPQAVSPVALNGRFFRRIGNSTREVPSEELPRFFLEKTGQSWDDLPSDALVANLSPEAVATFRLQAAPRLPQAAQTESDALLIEKLGLVHESGRLRRAGVLLFTEEPQRWFPMARIQAARFEDDEITLSDEKRFEGHFFQQLGGLLDWLRRHLRVTYAFPGEGEGTAALQRQESWEIPLVALREALLNALLHRDYTALSAIQVRVYADKVVIMNSGGLPERLTIADLAAPHASLPRNPRLATAAYQMGESWGTGTIRVIEACHRSGLQPPIFATGKAGFQMTLFRDPLTDEALRKRGLTETQLEGIKIARLEGRLTNKQYRTQNAMSDEAARRELNDLVTKGLLHREGSGRGVYYVIVGGQS
ncbi:ATP-binding protein [Armatimonas sp.]|uniref:ATP-binding protein n=1 Tax=Armatimonas sp. TaxID=1872638 RepID=UPI00286A5E44|nr:ATP-binding protein [Armatimonas sp.]